jgi:hypothetical protein
VQVLESIEQRTSPAPPCEDGLVAGAEAALLGAVTGFASSAAEGLGAVADAVSDDDASFTTYLVLLFFVSSCILIFRPPSPSLPVPLHLAVKKINK